MKLQGTMVAWADNRGGGAGVCVGMRASRRLLGGREFIYMVKFEAVEALMARRSSRGSGVLAPGFEGMGGGCTARNQRTCDGMHGCWLRRTPCLKSSC